MFALEMLCHEAQLSPCRTETQARLNAEAELEDSDCSGPPEEPVAATMGVTGQLVQPFPVSAGGSAEPVQHPAKYLKFYSWIWILIKMI